MAHSKAPTNMQQDSGTHHHLSPLRIGPFSFFLLPLIGPSTHFVISLGGGGGSAWLLPRVMLNFAIAMEATPISFPYHSLGLWGAPSHLDSGISASQRLLTMLAESAVARGNEGWVTRMSNITSGRKNAGTFVATATWPATMIALLQFRNRHCVYPFRQSGLVSECCCCVRSPFNTVQVSTETANQHAPR